MNQLNALPAADVTSNFGVPTNGFFEFHLAGGRVANGTVTMYDMQPIRLDSAVVDADMSVAAERLLDEFRR